MTKHKAVEKAMSEGYRYIVTFGGKLHLTDWLEMTCLENVTYENGRIVSPWLKSILEPGKMERAVFELSK